MVILELIHAKTPDFLEGWHSLALEPTRSLLLFMVIIMTERIASCDSSFEFLTYQLPSVGYWPTEAVTGNGELGFDSGEGA
jgi:hypothetical protein